MTFEEQKELKRMELWQRVTVEGIIAAGKTSDKCYCYRAIGFADIALQEFDKQFEKVESK